MWYDFNVFILTLKYGSLQYNFFFNLFFLKFSLSLRNATLAKSVFSCAKANMYNRLILCNSRNAEMENCHCVSMFSWREKENTSIKKVPMYL